MTKKKVRVVVLIIKRNKRVVGREAALVENEHKTLSGRYPTRFAELQAAYAGLPAYVIERTVQDGWPDWA